MVRGVVVDRGHHQIDLRYRPMSVYVGGILTGVSLLAVSLIWLLFARHRAHDDRMFREGETTRLSVSGI
jgi:hypothetical protein